MDVTTKARLLSLAAKARVNSPSNLDTQPSKYLTQREEHKILLLHTINDTSYLPALKKLVSANVAVYTSSVVPRTLTELDTRLHQGNYTGVLFCSEELLKVFTKDTKSKLSEFAGSLFVTSSGIECVCLNSLNRLFTVPYENFVVARYITKLTAKHNWLPLPKVDYTVVNNVHQFNEALNWLSLATVIAYDIETLPNMAIRCISYTGWYHKTGKFLTFVLPITDLDQLSWMRVLNQLPVPKVTQNGKYDNSYLYLYNAVVTNWYWDTATMQHCWLAELPKDLGYLGAFYIRDSMYWKGKWDTNDLVELYEYAAKDTHNTMCVMLGWFNEAPDWARSNYLQEFPVNYPAHVCEMTGIKLDLERLEKVKEEKLAVINQRNSRLSKLFGVDYLNVSSPVQVKAVTKILNGSPLESTDEKSLVKLANKHPLNKLVVDEILEIRGDRKLVSTYLKEDIAFSYPVACPNLRIVYSINPHGTDTGRNASRGHHFWKGLNIQNIPRGDTIKQIALAEDGFFFGEADYSQAESRGTGYITGETKLIEAVEGENDFHAFNASAFFGIPYNQIFDNATGKTLDKPLRDLSKRVNHGANYNMGEAVLVDTMGELNVYRAGKLLGLPLNWTAKEIAGYLLAQFDATYPKIRGAYQDWTKLQITTKRTITGATGWTRYFFGDPVKNKLHLNSAVAHNPQSLNAMIVNKAFMRVFYEVWLPNPADFLLHAQIHDSILFQYRATRPELVTMVADCMNIPVDVTDITGITRTMVVPTDIKGGTARWDGE